MRLKQVFTIRYNCLFQGSKLARLPPPESALEVILINCKTEISLLFSFYNAYIITCAMMLILSILMCSSSGGDIWLWWFDFFITHDFYLSICPDISKIRHKEVNNYYQLLFMAIVFIVSQLWILLGAEVLSSSGIQDIFRYMTLKKKSFLLTQIFMVLLWFYPFRCIKQFAWFFAVIQSLLIIASRKHYTVDIVVAW